MTARAAFKAAESFDVELPRPLRRPARSSAPYPVAALGDELAATVNAAVAIVQVPDAMAAQSVLSVLALAAQAYAFGEGRRFAASGSGGLSERYVCVGFPVPWEQLGEAVLRDVGDAGEDIG